MNDVDKGFVEAAKSGKDGVVADGVEQIVEVQHLQYEHDFRRTGAVGWRKAPRSKALNGATSVKKSRLKGSFPYEASRSIFERMLMCGISSWIMADSDTRTPEMNLAGSVQWWLSRRCTTHSRMPWCRSSSCSKSRMAALWVYNSTCGCTRGEMERVVGRAAAPPVPFREQVAIATRHRMPLFRVTPIYLPGAVEEIHAGIERAQLVGEPRNVLLQKLDAVEQRAVRPEFKAVHDFAEVNQFADVHVKAGLALDHSEEARGARKKSGSAHEPTKPPARPTAPARGGARWQGRDL